MALSLSTFVLAAVAFAIDVHLRMLTAGRAKIEEGQLARALLEKIAADLRNVVVIQASDSQSSQASAGSQSSADSATSQEASPESGVSEIEPLTPQSTTSSEETGDQSQIGLPQDKPGLYGGTDWLQVDVHRLPRLDQYQYDVLPTDGSGNTDRVSDIKTVAYYLASSLGLTGTTGATADASGGGLMRRELDRAITAWANEQGTLGDVDQSLEPIAPEVSSIQFAYFDGTEWLDYWDMEEEGGLPVAVLIVLTMTSVSPNSPGSSYFNWLPGATDTSVGESTAYSLLVNLPVANPASPQQSTETTEETTSQPAATGSSATAPQGM